EEEQPERRGMAAGMSGHASGSLYRFHGRAALVASRRGEAGPWPRERMIAMFVARWQLTAQFGKGEDTIPILRRWEIDVGVSVGWKPSSVRILAGYIGSASTEVAFEARAENLTDLESAFHDMDRNPHHREYLKQLEHTVTNAVWTVQR